MRAFLYAYDKVNLGDDLFIRFLVNRYPKVKFYMWSDKKNKKIFGDLKNLHIVNRNGWLPSLLRRIRPSLVLRLQAMIKDRCNRCIYIGGSIFQEYETWSNIVNWWDYQSKHYQFYVLGANFGPYKSDEYKNGMKNVFSQLEDICFRDKYSYELFKEVSKVRIAPDILFAQTLPEINAQKKQIFMSVINCRNDANGLADSADKYEECMSKMICDYTANGYDVKLVSFCKEEGDEEICYKLKGMADNEGSLSLLYYNGTNYMEILGELAASEYVVGTRFHATVLGLAFDKKVLPVLYSDKTKNMLADIGFEGMSIDLREEITPVLFRELQEGSRNVNSTFCRKESEQHFEKLDIEFKRG